MILAGLSHHIHKRSTGFNVCDDCPRRIPPLGVIVVVAIVVATATAFVVVGSGGLLGERDESGKATTTKRALHVGTCSNQRCKTGDWLDA